MDISKKCVICRKDSGNGISVLGRFICCECEENVVHTDVYDEDYDIYKDLIKKNIFGDIIIRQPAK